MFFHDPIYLVVMMVGGLLVFLPQIWVQRTVAKFVEVPIARGLTGAEVAQRILAEHQMHDVSVELTPGELSDHYDPSHKAVRLSHDIYYGRSIAGVAIAAHEVGHAIQHATGYYPVVLRSAMVPAVNLGSQLGPMMFFIAVGLGASSEAAPGWAWMLGWVGVALFGMAVLFHVVTLPVEINASMRAMRILNTGGYLTTAELPGGKQVLTAAAFTYVAAALYSLIQLLYFVFRLLGNRREE